jgi:gamma-glutamyltranspeptidase/glutathione hydrolase
MPTYDPFVEADSRGFVRHNMTRIELPRRRLLAAIPTALAAAGYRETCAAPATTLAAEGTAAAPAPGDIEPAAKSPQTDRNAFLNRRSPIFTRRCIASSSSPLATQAGFRVLADGGNAFDAAITMAGMMGVIEPMFSGLGGDTMILVWSAKDRKVYGLNGSGAAPSGASLARLPPGTFVPDTGPLSVTIPGAVDGWCVLHERFGSKPLASLWEPAVAAAREGFPVGESIAGMWNMFAPALPKLLSPELSRLVLPGGKPPVPGQIIRFAQLAETLERVAKGGREAFYDGPVAQTIADTLTKGGVPTTLGDLARQRAQWVEPISVRYRGRDVLQLPPNSQGVVALQALGILEGYDLAAMSPADRMHHEIEAIRIAFAFAIDEVGDPTDAMMKKVQHALSPAALAESRARITDRALPLGRAVNGNSSDTTYMCAIDAEGNIVSMMSSIMGLFGSGLLAGDTGVILNNRAAAFSKKQGSPNALTPGRRPRHTILPGMAMRDGEPEIVMGCIGLNNHPQGTLQILVNVLDLGMNTQQSMDAPRFRVIMDNDEVTLDAAIPDDVRRDLAARGHRIGDPTAFYGGAGFKGAAQMVRIHRGEDGVGPCLESGVDHRLDGVALGW